MKDLNLEKTKMLGIHTVYTNNGQHTKMLGDMLQFEVSTMVLSCLNWKYFNGPIKLYCDDYFLEYIESLGIDWLWDEIDTEVLNNLPTNINYSTFWAYPKIYVNSLQTKPFANLDIDLYIDGPLIEGDYDVLFCNLERCDNEKWYPPYHTFDEYRKRLTYPNIEDFAANVGLLIVKDLEFYENYIDVVNNFVIGNDLKPLENTHNSSLITFIEQRLLLSMLVNENIPYMSHMEGLYSSKLSKWEGEINTNLLTHLWGWKDSFRKPENENQKISLTNELKDELKNNFPKQWDRVRQIFELVPL
jgi:hypothetical protein